MMGGGYQALLPLILPAKGIQSSPLCTYQTDVILALQTEMRRTNQIYVTQHNIARDVSRVAVASSMITSMR